MLHYWSHWVRWPWSVTCHIVGGSAIFIAIVMLVVPDHIAWGQAHPWRLESLEAPAASAAAPSADASLGASVIVARTVPTTARRFERHRERQVTHTPVVSAPSDSAGSPTVSADEPEPPPSPTRGVDLGPAPDVPPEIRVAAPAPVDTVSMPLPAGTPELPTAVQDPGSTAPTVLQSNATVQLPSLQP
jgi:hypothetical protein